MSGRYGVPPPNYRNAPPRGTAGIPRSFLQPATAETPGAKLAPTGKCSFIQFGFKFTYF